MGIIGKSILTPGNVISILVVAVIFFVIYLPTISSIVYSYTRPEKVIIPLSAYGSFANPNYNDFLKYSHENTGVDDYRTKIYVTFNMTNVEIGSSVQFHVKIEDPDGRLVKSYFYIFIVNNTENLVSSFPQYAFLTQSSKSGDWPMNANDDLELQIKGDTFFVSRSALITGEGNSWKDNNQYSETCDIWFEKQIQADPSQIGRWQVWVFAYDEQYKTADGQDLGSTNAITYTTEFFDVTSEKQSSSIASYEPILWWVSSALTFAVSVVGMFWKVSPWINTRSEEIMSWFRRNRSIIVLLVIVVFINIILFFLKVMAPS